MTLMDQPRVRRRRYAVRLNAVKFFYRWRELQQQRRDRRALAELPDYLLRDVGIQHVVNRDHDTKSHYQW